MPKKYPPEFKPDVVTVARRGDVLPEVAADFDVSEVWVRRGQRQAEIEDGIVKAQTNSQQSGLVQPRRRMRELETENDILPPRRGLLPAGLGPK